MLPSLQDSPATPVATANRDVPPTLPPRPSSVPRVMANAPDASGIIWMVGMPCYGEHAPPGIAHVLAAAERAVIKDDYSRHRGYLNKPDYVFNIDACKATAHVAYRVLCTEFERPGRYAIRHAEQGAFMLVHRSQRTPQLVRTALKHSARGWHLDVADTANSGWNGVRGRHFATLDALKAALPPGMHEVTGASLHDLQTPL